jgi:hypothetical protein
VLPRALPNTNMTAGLDDLTHALTIREDPRALLSRARFQALQRWQEAANDFLRALELGDT